MADRPEPPFPGQMPSSFDGNEEFFNERPMQKAIRKVKEEPLVPLGIGLTVFAFVGAYRALRRGDSQQANRMFRARVAAQGFTVVAMVAGSMYYSRDREKTAELRKLKEQRDAEEKRQRWIHELEVRDEEEKAMKAHLEKRVQMSKANIEGESQPAPATTQGAGGILGKLGLWSQGEKTAADGEAAESVEAADEKKPKKSNPKSSLGAIGEVIASQKKDDSKSAEEGSKK